MSTRYANTFAIRNGAYAFSQAAQDMLDKGRRLSSVASTLTEGGRAWKGEGALGFLSRAELMEEDARLTYQAFEQVSQALNALAGQLDQVNQLRMQADQLQAEIHSLEQQSWGADDTERASIHSQISHLSYRKQSLLQEADSMESRANQAATESFQAAGDQANRLHYTQEGSFEIDPLAPFIGFSKGVGTVGMASDLKDIIRRRMKGFGVTRMKTSYGEYYAFVENGAAEGIRGTRYYFSNAQYYEQVMKYVDKKVAVEAALKDVKGLGTLLGYASVAIDTVSHLKTNIEEGRSVSHTVSEAVVDVGVGVGTVAASAYVGAMVGTAIGGPVGTLVGGLAGLGVGYISSLITDGTSYDGKTVGDHLKSGLESAIDGGAHLFESGVDAVSSIFS